MILNRAQDRLYVAVDNSDTMVAIDTGMDKVIETSSVVAPRSLLPAGTVPKGANPNSLALSPDEKTLYVTEGGLNAVAVVNLTAAPGQPGCRTDSHRCSQQPIQKQHADLRDRG